LKGDVIGFVNKAWLGEKTGWGWVEGVIWHPKGIQLILEKKLPAFSIEVVPETIWDPEHQHDHIIDGKCVGLAVVPKGACVTCTPTEATMGEIRIEKGKVYKYGQTAEEYIMDLYWGRGYSTEDIAKLVNKHRTTIENWMNLADIPRRDLQEARHLRGFKEEAVRKFGGRAFMTALGTGSSKQDKRNLSSTLLTIGTEHILINAPKGIAAMIGNIKLKPKYVLVEHEDAADGLHELRALKPTVFAMDEVWKFIRKNYKVLSGEQGTFEDLYDFERKG
ncbi:unnamed protein product, partial [marine sediment metagenome]